MLTWLSVQNCTTSLVTDLSSYFILFFEGIKYCFSSSCFTLLTSIHDNVVVELCEFGDNCVMFGRLQQYFTQKEMKLHKASYHSTSSITALFTRLLLCYLLIVVTYLFCYFLLAYYFVSYTANVSGSSTVSEIGNYRVINLV